MHRRTWLLLLLFAPGVAIFGAQITPSQRLEALFQSFADEWMRYDSDLAAQSRYFTGPEQDAASRKISPRTGEWRQGRVRLAERGLKQLRAFDRTGLTDTQRISADLMAYQLEGIVQEADYSAYSFPLVQVSGVPAGLTSLMTVSHPIATPRDAENYVARLAQIAPRMEEAIAEARQSIQRKMLPPRFILQAAIREMQGFIGPEPAMNPLVVSFADRMRPVPGLSSARQEQLQAEAEKTTATHVYPAWRKAIALLEPQVAQASDDAGLWRFPKGAEVYAFRLQRATTTNLTPDQIHEVGLRLEAEIERDMDQVLKQAGYMQGSVRERYDKLLQDQPTFPATEQGIADYRADIERTLADAQVRAASLFDRVPSAKVIAQPYPSFFGSRAASYTLPAADGSRPGTFQFTLQAGARKYSRSSIYHETVPGHHLHLALEMENPELPRWRRVLAYGGNSAITEGWALYAEQLAAESGWYEGDPVGLLSQLQRKLFRARRLVADTGLHTKRWSRQKAIDYLGPALETADAASEVDRYVVTPGQACSYMVGALRILELRERAKRELGAAFRLKEFHNVVLGTGIVPLDVLEQQVDRWIRSQKG